MKRKILKQFTLEPMQPLRDMTSKSTKKRLGKELMDVLLKEADKISREEFIRIQQSAKSIKDKVKKRTLEILKYELGEERLNDILVKILQYTKRLNNEVENDLLNTIHGAQLVEGYSDNSYDDSYVYNLKRRGDGDLIQIEFENTVEEIKIAQDKEGFSGFAAAIDYMKNKNLKSEMNKPGGIIRL